MASCYDVSRAILLGLALALALAAPAAAQVGGSDTALSLNRHLQALAADPRNVDALIGAGQSALSQGDAQSAAAFFARAEEVRPRDGRIKAGIAGALVQMEQPQAALKFFAEAVSLGQTEASVAGERGLAFDLIGDNRRAQADYRLALRQRGSDDELRRRLALSLAISGDRAAALTELDDQLRRQDRGAWRTRAFVLALTGDTAGAGEAAAAVMGASQAATMRDFFGKLPRLNPAQRAMAVHLGVFPADGRPVQMAETFESGSAVSALLADNAGVLAPGTGLLPRTPPAEPVSTAPRRRPGASEAADREARPGRSFRYDPVTRRRVPVTQTASRQIASVPAPREGPPPATSRAPQPSGSGFAPPRASETIHSPIPESRLVTTAQAPTPQADQTARRVEAPASQPAAKTAEATVRQQSAPLPAVLPSSTASAAPGFSSVVAGPPSQGMTGGELAAAASGAPPATPMAAPSTPPTQLLPASVAPSAATAVPPAASSSLPMVSPSRPSFSQIAASIASLTTEAPAPAAAAPIADPPLREPAIATPSRPAPARSRPYVEAPAPKTKKAAAKPPEPAKPSHPSRHWVQIAGGANKATLPREHARLKGLAPKLLGSRDAWTTPLRATNRLLVGPFDSARAAQAFVNDLGKSDITAFAWTSPEGQEIVKLPSR